MHTLNDISIRGMKRPHEMMNPISQMPFSTSAVEKGRGEGRHQGIPLFILPLLKARENRRKQEKQKTEKQ